MSPTLLGHDDLSRAHSRFAKAALALYVGAATVAIALLVATLLTDREFEERLIDGQLELETKLQAFHLGEHLALLVEELQRLGLRSEVDLLDENVAPERSLLALAHENSSFFNLGVAIVDARGDVVWAEPKAFQLSRTQIAEKSWFAEVQRERGVTIIPVDPDAKDAVLHVVSPVIRDGRFTGALIGGIDLAKEARVRHPDFALRYDTVLATNGGVIVYPPAPPGYAKTEAWKGLASQFSRPFAESVTLDGVPRRVTGTPLAVAPFVLLSVADAGVLYTPASERFRSRLVVGGLLAVLPLAVLVLLLRRSLRTFRTAEEAAVRAERVRRLGEAASVIAHEVRNSLNGIGVGVELLLSENRSPSAERVARELRGEISQLSDFSHELMLFAKDPKPAMHGLDLAEVVERALALKRDLASELGVGLRLEVEGNVRVWGDATLLRLAVSNLIANAIDASADAVSDARRGVTVELRRRDDQVELRVRDEGSGVPADMVRRLFEPFSSTKPSGVGIGLAMARKFALAHGGNLELEPTKVGACFVMSIPAEPS